MMNSLPVVSMDEVRAVPIFSWDIADLYLSIRSFNRMKRELFFRRQSSAYETYNVEDNTFVAELIELAEDRVARAPDIGKKSLMEIKQALASHGLRLGVEIKGKGEPEEFRAELQNLRLAREAKLPEIQQLSDPAKRCSSGAEWIAAASETVGRKALYEQAGKIEEPRLRDILLGRLRDEKITGKVLGERYDVSHQQIKNLETLAVLALRKIIRTTHFGM
jgi:hypothetical protein